VSLRIRSRKACFAPTKQPVRLHKNNVMFNPYIAGNPVGGDTAFIGRQDVLREVTRVLANPSTNAIVLYGQRRIGKTSILQQLAQQLPHAGAYLPVYFDLQDKAAWSLDKVLFVLAQTISADLDLPQPKSVTEESFQQQFLPQVLAHLTQIESSLVFLFDEFDVLDNPTDQAAGIKFFPYLTHLLNMAPRQLQFVFVIGRKLEDLTNSTLQVFKNIAAQRVSLLNEADTRQVILLSQENGSLQWPDEAINEIWQLTNGHPYLTQMLGQTIWDAAYLKDPDDAPTLTVEMVLAALPKTIESSTNALNWLWDGLPSSERFVSSALAQAGQKAISQDELEKLLTDNGVRVLISQLQNAPQLLVEWDLLERVNDGYRFRVELLRRWIAEKKPISRVRAELDQIEPVANNLYQAGKTLYLSRQIEQAITMLRQALTFNPNHIEAGLLLAQLLMANPNSLDEAIKLLEQILAYNPNAARHRLVQALWNKSERLTNEIKLIEVYKQIVALDESQSKAKELIYVISRPTYYLKANGLIKYMSGKMRLLDDISLAIAPGEFVAILGSSGSGKSTLLGALNGSNPMDSGQVLIKGEDLYFNFDKYRTEIGYVPQKNIIHENLTVEQVLRYTAYLRGVPHSKVESCIKDALDKALMDKKNDVLVKDLSSGQKKRVSFAVELIADPNIIFLDEVTSWLDPGLDKAIMEMLRNISEEGKIIVLTTSTTANIFACHLVVFLAKGGRLVFYGPPQEALKFFEVSRFSEIYQTVELEPDKWIKKFKGSDYEKKYINQRQVQANTANFASLKKVGFYELFRQIPILMQQNWAIIWADKVRLAWLTVFVPLLTVFILVFSIEYGLFSSEKLYSLNPMTVFPIMLNIQQSLFMMACIGTFFGLFGSIQEISKERSIYDREKLANLNIISYVVSKLIILAILALIQSFILVYTFDLWAKFPADGITEIPLFSAKLEIVVTLFLTLIASSSLGLLVSAWVKDKQDGTTGILTILVIMQIVFSGILFKLEGWWKILSWFTFTRWSTEAMGSVIGLGKLSVASQLFLTYGDRTHLLQNWLILLGYTLFFIIGTIWVLQNQDITRSFKNKRNEVNSLDETD